MHSSQLYLSAENTNPAFNTFIEEATNTTPSLFHYHHPQPPDIIFRQHLQEFPATFPVERRLISRVEEQQFTSHQGRAGDSRSLLIPFVNVSFIGLGSSDNNSTCHPSRCYPISQEEHARHLMPQDDSSWREARVGDLNPDEIEKYSETGKNGSLVLSGELESVYNLAKTKELISQACLSSAVKAKSPPQAVLNHASDGLRSASKEKAKTRKERRKRKRNKLEKELRSTGTFSEALLKQVMDHQNSLNRKFLEMVERMERERVEREEEWRRQEARRRESEALERAQERAMGSSREALMVEYIQKITCQNPNLRPRDEDVKKCVESER